MSLWATFLGGGATPMPNLASKLRLESLDERIVPDATPMTNPLPTTGTVGTSTTQLNISLDSEHVAWFFAQNGEVAAVTQDNDGNLLIYFGTVQNGLQSTPVVLLSADPVNGGFLAEPQAAAAPPVQSPAGGIVGVINTIFGATGGKISKVTIEYVGLDGITYTITIQPKPPAAVLGPPRPVLPPPVFPRLEEPVMPGIRPPMVIEERIPAPKPPLPTQPLPPSVIPDRPPGT